jgi:hypothetical protein
MRRTAILFWSRETQAALQKKHVRLAIGRIRIVFQEYSEFTKLAARSTVFSIDIGISRFVGNKFVCNNVPAYNSCNVAPQRACS